MIKFIKKLFGIKSNQKHRDDMWIPLGENHKDDDNVIRILVE